MPLYFPIYSLCPATLAGWAPTFIDLPPGITECRDFNILTKSNPCQVNSSFSAKLGLCALPPCWSAVKDLTEFLPQEKQDVSAHGVYLEMQAVPQVLCDSCRSLWGRFHFGGRRSRGEATSPLNWAHFAVLLDSRAPHCAQMLH